MTSRLLLTGLLLAGSAVADLHPGNLVPLPESARMRMPADAVQFEDGRFAVRLPYGTPLVFEVTGTTTHKNGDVTIVGLAADGEFVHATLGRRGAFGQWHHGGRDYLLTTDADGTWLVELPPGGAVYNLCGVGPEQLRAGRSGKTKATHRTIAAAADNDHTIDLLLIYTRGFSDRYSGDLLETRLNHLVAIANQAFANSSLSLGLRVVGSEQVGYTDANTNSTALEDVATALGGAAVPGLGGLAALRNSLGADLVIMLRPHDIEARGSCGIAFYPADDDRLGVNVVSDGMSSWSICLDDVMTHEIGHNLGAAHQLGAGGGSFDPRGSAFVRPGQFTTVMASFGTGRPDRFRGLRVFSNPAIRCGGQPCGFAADTDNVSVMRELLPAVSAYRSPVSALPVPPELPRAEPDSDGDGVTDWEDHFPFSAAEQWDTDLDGTSDTRDSFPFDPAEQIDSDGDGTGDNADTDDDGDGVPDTMDAFPLDPAESSDSDRDGIGDNADVFSDDPDEFRDFDGDGIGNNEDPDDDGDGYPELDPVAEDLLVISTGNNRILRFDAWTGASRGVEVPSGDALLTFQSDLSYRPDDHTLLYLGDSSVRRLDLLSRALLGTWVPPYDEVPETPQLGTGFPTGIAWIAELGYVAVTRMEERRIALFRGLEQPMKPLALEWVLSERESPVAVTADGPAALILGQANRSLYRADGLGAQLLSGPGAEWMRDPRHLALSGDGRLLVSDKGRDAVVQLEAASGIFLGELVQLRDYGYRDPSGLAVTHDGTLLVASTPGHAILRFDINTGAFLGELVSRRRHGLRRPEAMVLVPQLIDRFNADPSRVIRPNPGLWYNPATEGRGFDIEVFGDRLSAIWYTYDTEGLPLWYISAGDLVGFDYEGPLLRFRMLADGTTTFEEVGTLRLSFASERSAEMNFVLGETRGVEPLQWLAFDPNPAARDYTGLWGRADGPGWGLSLATQGNRTVAIAFIFDEAGEPRWLISDTLIGASPLLFTMSASFSDTLCPACSGQPAYEFQPAGNMLLEVPVGASWSSDIQFPAPLTGTWMLDEVPIVRFSEPPRRPR